MDSTYAESSSEDEDEKKRIADIVKALTFDSDCDSLVVDVCNNHKSVEVGKAVTKPSLRHSQREEEEMMSLGSPQFRLNVGRSLTDLLDSLYSFEDKISTKYSGKSGSRGECLSGVQLFKSSGFVDMEPHCVSKTREKEKPSRNICHNSESSSNEEEGHMDLIKQATVDGWSIIKDGGLVSSQSSDSKTEVSKVASQLAKEKEATKGSDMNKSDQTQKPKKKRKRKSPLSDDLQKEKELNDEGKSHENPKAKENLAKRQSRIAKHEQTEQEGQSSSFSRKPSKNADESQDNQSIEICEDKQLQGKRKRKPKKEKEAEKITNSEVVLGKDEAPNGDLCPDEVKQVDEPVRKKKRKHKRTGSEAVGCPSGLAGEGSVSENKISDAGKKRRKSTQE